IRDDLVTGVQTCALPISVTPKLVEVKKVYQYIAFSAVDLIKGKIRVRNKYAFTNLSAFDGRWQLTEDGRTIDEGKFAPLNIAPRSEERRVGKDGKTWWSV